MGRSHVCEITEGREYYVQRCCRGSRGWDGGNKNTGINVVRARKMKRRKPDFRRQRAKGGKNNS